jgi:hypothetical protein
MDKEQIKKLAMQAGEYTNEVYVPPVRSKTPGKIWEDGHVGWHDIFNDKFAELAAAHEREACAKVCDDMASKNHAEHHLCQHQIDKGVRLSKAVGLSEGAAAIRARK